MKSMRAPSYKAIAIAILKNDLQLSALGFSRPESKWYDELKLQRKKTLNPQMELL